MVFLLMHPRTQKGPIAPRRWALYSLSLSRPVTSPTCSTSCSARSYGYAWYGSLPPLKTRSGMKTTAAKSRALVKRRGDHERPRYPFGFASYLTGGGADHVRNAQSFGFGFCSASSHLFVLWTIRTAFSFISCSGITSLTFGLVLLALLLFQFLLPKDLCCPATHEATPHCR